MVDIQIKIKKSLDNKNKILTNNCNSFVTFKIGFNFFLINIFNFMKGFFMAVALLFNYVIYDCLFKNDMHSVEPSKIHLIMIYVRY